MKRELFLKAQYLSIFAMIIKNDQKYRQVCAVVQYCRLFINKSLCMKHFASGCLHCVNVMKYLSRSKPVVLCHTANFNVIPSKYGASDTNTFNL